MSAKMEMAELIDRSCVLHQSAGSDGFGRSIFDFASTALGLEKCTAYYYPLKGPPQCIAAAGINSYYDKFAATLASKYVSGAYRHDPNTRYFRPTTTNSFHLNLVRPSDLPASKFRQDFYESPGIGEELGLISENERGRLYLSLFRSSERPRLNASRIARVRELAPILMTAVSLHLKLGQAAPVDEALSVEMESTAIMDIIRQHCDRISTREIEICDHIVRGYSTVAMSLTLGISGNTVRTFRKRAYAKLGISSQAELFAIIYKRLTSKV